MDPNLIADKGPPEPRLTGNTPPVIEPPPDPVDPPRTLKGSYSRCGGCNDYLTGDRCPRCAPATVDLGPFNIPTM